MSAINPDFAQFHYGGAAGTAPPGVAVGLLYSFAALAPADYNGLMVLALQELPLARARLGIAAAPVAVVPAGVLPAVAAVGGAGALHAVVAVPPAVAVAPGALPEVWVSLEDETPYTKGQVLQDVNSPLPAGSLTLGPKALVPTVGSACASIRLPPGQAGACKFDDLRVLPVLFDSQGIRGRSFGDAVNLLNDAPPAGGGLQLAGPASSMTVMKSIRAQSFTPVTHHEFWLRQARISDGDRSAFEHEVLSHILEAMVVVDQLNVCALKSAELVVRRRQLIQEAHRVSPGAPDYSAADIYMGWSGRRHGGVDPALTQFVAAELRNEAAVAKEARKAREEAVANRGRRRGRGRGRNAAEEP
jgi:hypothetical protein